MKKLDEQFSWDIKEYCEQSLELLYAIMRLCMQGIVDTKNEVDFRQVRYDACHLFMEHIYEFVKIVPFDNPEKNLAYAIWKLILSNNLCKKFVYEYHLATMVNFESRYSPKKFLKNI